MGSGAPAHARAPGAVPSGRQRRGGRRPRSRAPQPSGERDRRLHALDRPHEHALGDVLELPGSRGQEHARHPRGRHPEAQRMHERVEAEVLGVLGPRPRPLQVDQEPSARIGGAAQRQIDPAVEDERGIGELGPQPPIPVKRTAA